MRRADRAVPGPECSRRRQACRGREGRLRYAQVCVTNAVVHASTSTIWERLKLQGMSGLEGQRLALINGATVAVGEIADIKCDGIVKVRCVEIRDRSVVLELVASGETREIRLRDNI